MLTMRLAEEYEVRDAAAPSIGISKRLPHVERSVDWCKTAAACARIVYNIVLLIIVRAVRSTYPWFYTSSTPI